MESAGASSSSSKGKNTVYVAGLAAEVNEQQLLDAFVTFGDILEISLPTDPQDHKKHRGFAFLTFSNPADAADAIDNFDLNELPGYVGRGKFLKCSLANPDRFGAGGGREKFDRPIWESEEWLQKHAKALDDGEAQAQAANGEGEGEEES